MGSSFVRVGEHGFWMRDGVLELWLRLLALHLEDPIVGGPEAARIRDQWLKAASVGFVGCIPVMLHEAISTPEGDALVRKAIHSLMQRLERAPETLSKDVLNLLNFPHGKWERDFETWRLLEVGQAFLDLMDGRITTNPSRTEFMPGCRERPAHIGPLPHKK